MGPIPVKPKLSAWSIVLGVLVAVLQAVNQNVLTGHSDKPARGAIAVALTFFGTVGISALFGPRLTTLLHVPAKVLLTISAGLTAANGILTLVAISTLWHTILVTGITLIGAVLFGSDGPAPAPVAPVARAV